MSQTLTLEERVSHVEQDLAELKSHVDRLRSKEPGTGQVRREDPWRKIVGIYRDDPLFEEWQRAIAEYRREVDQSDAP